MPDCKDVSRSSSTIASETRHELSSLYVESTESDTMHDFIRVFSSHGEKRPFDLSINENHEFVYFVRSATNADLVIRELTCSRRLNIRSHFPIVVACHSCE